MNKENTVAGIARVAVSYLDSTSDLEKWVQVYRGFREVTDRRFPHCSMQTIYHGWRRAIKGKNLTAPEGFKQAIRANRKEAA